MNSIDNLYLLLAVVWFHWLADYVLQTDWMALNKSKANYPLLVHVGSYTLMLMIFGWKFAIVNGFTHLIIDYFTSRWSSQAYARGNRHGFFVILGFDQALHLSFLIMTLPLTWMWP